MKPLVVIPNYMTDEADVAVLVECLRSIRTTVSDTVEILVVDDCSPVQPLVDVLVDEHGRWDFEIIRKPENEGFSRTVNVGLQRALDEGREVVLMNADMKMLTPGWVRRCRDTTSPIDGSKAAVVGALLSYPNGLIQHAGVFMSLLTRGFDHIYKYGPENLPEALHKRVCPVTGAFQFIRPETLEKVGVYDPQFRMGFEDVDYCIRVMKEDLACVYNPNVRAIHYESMFRGRPSEKLAKWQAESLMYLISKWQDQNLQGLVPTYWEVQE